MNGVLVAKLTIFLKLDSVGIVFLILHIVVVSVLALGASKCDSRSHS